MLRVFAFKDNAPTYATVCGWAVHGFEVRRERRWRIG
jgi:hypothetical protein